MEHRCGTRHRVEGELTLRAHGGSAITTARLVEASISGMFIAAPAAPFACNAVIDVEMTLPGDSSLRTYRWQAMVIRKTERGVGLMFDRLRPHAINWLIASAEAGMPLPHTRATTGSRSPSGPRSGPNAGPNSGALSGKAPSL